ncbi:adenylyltransferase/sulfurtransferase MoeZ [Microbacterium marinilacus]|uniref:Adenylyltransferase/sulfurtransferase MoeZ n=2 Tax=Microbacterium marinilacus TaxID=415209 RepID=A0ABP7B3X9_9MICO
MALAAAGVGTLTVIDDDVVELSNLQRQLMHRVADVGEPKALSAARAASDLAPEVRVHAVRERLTPDNAAHLLAGADLVLDGSDTFDTREAVAAGCEQLGVPLVWGTVQGFDAQVTVFWSAPPAGIPAVRLSDLYPTGSAGDVPTCAEVGVLGSLCLQVGALMATQAIQLIAGIGEPLLGRVLVIDGLRASQRTVPLKGVAREDAPPRDPSPRAAVAGGSSAPGPVESRIGAVPERIRPAALAERLEQPDAPLVVDVREIDELRTGMIPGSLHVPLGEVRADPDGVARRVRDEAGGRGVAVVCRGGVRSAQAAAALAGRGLDAVTLEGGLLAWRGPLAMPAAAR